GADGHEAAGTQRELAGVARQEIEPDRRQRVNEERDQHRLQPVLARDERRHDERRRHGRGDEDAILDDREDRLVGAVRRLERRRLAIGHLAAPGGPGGVGAPPATTLANTNGAAFERAADKSVLTTRVAGGAPTPPGPPGGRRFRLSPRMFTRSHALDDLLAEEALGARQQEGQGEDVGKPVLDGAAHQRPPVDLPELLADADDEPAD